MKTQLKNKLKQGYTIKIVNTLKSGKYEIFLFKKDICHFLNFNDQVQDIKHLNVLEALDKVIDGTFFNPKNFKLIKYKKFDTIKLIVLEFQNLNF